MVALAVIWGMTIDKYQAEEIANALHQIFPWWWLAMIGLAYLVGQVADSFTWQITNPFAKRHLERRARKDPGWIGTHLDQRAGELSGAKPKTAREEIDARWAALFDVSSRNRDPHPETVSIMKSQIESRSMMNLSVLLLGSVITAIISLICGGQQYTLVGSRVSRLHVWLLLVVLIVMSFLCALAAWKRQGRQVVGMISVLRDTVDPT